MGLLDFCRLRAAGVPVTIVTVTFDDKAALERTLHSVESQDYAHLEHVIVDGGSSDGSVDVIRQYGHTNVTWVSEPDNGIYDAMNKGVRMAKGVWVNFMNSGDTFVHESTVSQLVEQLQPDDDLVYGDTNFVSEDSQEVIKAKGPETLWMALNFNHNSLFVRRELLLRHPFNLNYNIVADSEFVIWCYRNDCSFRNTGQVINNYRRGGYSDENSVMRSIERWKLVSDYKLQDQDRINEYYFQRLLWEDFYKDYLRERYNCRVQ